MSLEKSCKELKSLRNIAYMRQEEINQILAKRKDSLEELEMDGIYVSNVVLGQCNKMTMLKMRYIYSLSWQLLPSMTFLTKLEMRVSGQAMMRFLRFPEFKETFKPHCLASLIDVNLGFDWNSTKNFMQRFCHVFALATPNLQTLTIECEHYTCASCTILPFVDNCPQLQNILAPNVRYLKKLVMLMQVASKKLNNLQVIYMPHLEVKSDILTKCINKMFRKLQNLLLFCDENTMHVQIDSDNVHKQLIMSKLDLDHVDLKVIYQLLRKLKRDNLYDNTVIVMHAKHTLNMFFDVKEHLIMS